MTICWWTPTSVSPGWSRAGTDGSKSARIEVVVLSNIVIPPKVRPGRAHDCQWPPVFETDYRMGSFVRPETSQFGGQEDDRRPSRRRRPERPLPV